ncbi:pentatricopeptide repeat-containing protein DOT4, chloroplastic [Ziziphus jujuba]|uniref:Pentatricopeptide repeat-containing protein DOT4, chloroplastic n=1 Tax=Ziziphus jujuba TaxID=326968 RepID=A0ABM3IK65_ZIZJJ|nr:pentatricopeptide repeat-containing protein DOT4, chloroplastic [Ziziphus jujuba]
MARQLDSYSLCMYRNRSFQHDLPRPSEVIIPHASSSISLGSKLNFRAETRYQENPSRKSVLRHGFMWDGSIIDVSSSGKLVKEYVDDGRHEDAVQVYVKMLECGIPVEEFRFFPMLIKAFGAISDIEKVRQIHGHLLKLGALDDIYVLNSLLGVYWKCGVAEDAIQLFEKICTKDLVSWNTMISGFCHSGDYMGSLRIFSQMIRQHGVFPNRVACLSALSSCASIESLIHGREIHAFVVKNNFGDEFLFSALIDMYMKCGDVKNAEFIFGGILNDDSIKGNTVVWNVMISGYVSNGYLSQAVELFQEMLAIQILPDFSTMIAVSGLCSELLDLAVGKQIHVLAISFGLDNDSRVETALIDMYFKCGDPKSGLDIFRKSQNHNTVMWGAVISNCAQSGSPTEALELFHDYNIEYGFVDPVIVLAVLRACSSLILKGEGMEIHGLVVKSGFDSDVFVGGALVDMYAKCGDIESAQKVFHRLPSRDLVSWNALILGYAQNECPNETLKAFRDMQSELIQPNTVSCACILSVCALLSAMLICKEVHGYLLRQGFDSNVLISNSLITTYAKCGDINSSWVIFEKMSERNQISWNSILLGLGMYGHADKVFALFGKMKDAGTKPDHATFTALLSACSHAGRVEEGWKYFRSMVEDYKIEPQLEQYTCMVDLLGRADHLKQAYEMILMMPCVFDDRIWGSLLASCKSHGDERLAEVVASHIFKLDPASIGYRVLLANLYEDYGKWNEVTRVRTEIKGRGLKKRPGCSWIEIKNKTHTFTAGDSSHNQSEEIYAAIDSLTTQIAKAGCI